MMGLITGHVPFWTHRNSEARLIAVAVGNAFHVYDLEKLSIVYISPNIDENILEIVSHKDYVYTLLGEKILKWRRMHVDSEFDIGPNAKNMLVFGEVILFTQNESIFKLDMATGERLEIPVGHEIEIMQHPSFYMNKVIITQGSSIELWNVNSGKLIH